MKTPRFMLRDLFWLILVAAILLAWWVREQQAHATLMAHVRVIRFLTNTLGNHDYLIDFYPDGIVLNPPISLRKDVGGAVNLRLSMDNPPNGEHMLQFQNDTYERLYDNDYR